MKVAVIGGGVLGLEMASRLHEMEAAVTIFTRSGKLGGKLNHLLELYPAYEISGMPVSTFFRERVEGLAKKIYESIPVKNVEVLRVQKRFLKPGEKVEGRSRLADMFRLVYRVDPTSMIESQKKENPDVYKNFDESMLQSLSEHMESFEDFDLVIDARGKFDNSFKLGPAGVLALNETSLMKDGELLYGWEALASLKEAPPVKRLTLVGGGELVAIAVLNLKSWLADGGELSIVCQGEDPFKDLPAQLKRDIDAFMKGQQEFFKKKMEEYRDKVFEWRGLDEHIKAKSPMPAEPAPPFDILLNSYVTAVDRLIDQKGQFLTIESPDYSKGKEEMRTLGTDLILGLSGFSQDSSLYESLESEEPGFYSMASDGLEEGLTRIDPIIENILSFFTRKED